MTKVILALFFTFSSLAFAEVKKSPWQITFQYGPDSVKVVDVAPFKSVAKKISGAGIKISVETYAATVTWKLNGATVFRSTGEVGFGNRFDERCKGDVSCLSKKAGAAVLRLMGPPATTSFNAVELDLSILSSHFGVLTKRAFDKKKIIYNPTDRISLRDGPISATKILDTGPDANRFVLVVLSEGYTASQLSAGSFSADAQSIITYLNTQSPWHSLLAVTNVYLISVESNESGADDPLGSPAQTVDTYFNTSFGTSGIDRLLAPDGAGETRAIAAANDYVGQGLWNAVIILVNSTKYGGSGGVVATSSIHPLAPEIAVHELGHTVAGLADEYSDEYPGYPEGDSEPNVDFDGTAPKWTRWLTSGVPLPTSDSERYDDVVGAFEGARYRSTGIYRPMRTCKMKVLGVDFCSVCKEAFLRSALQYAHLYDAVTPAARSSVKLKSSKKKFRITKIPFQKISTQWKLCGKTLQSTASSLQLTKSSLSKRRCSLSAILKTKSSLIKNNIQESVSWTVTR